jgi:glycerol-3-phosphate acyltransferase PlsY
MKGLFFHELEGVFWGAILSFALGSIPFGVLAGKLKGIDVREKGSGNVGATNVTRVLGREWGLLVFLFDCGKGFLVPWASFFFLGASPERSSQDLYRAVTGLAAILGHMFSPWLGGRGGKGVATGTGVLAACLPKTLWVAAPVWLLFFLATRIVSVASLAASIAVPVASWLLYPDRPWLWFFSVTSALLVLLKHRKNLERLFAGTEHRF